MAISTFTLHALRDASEQIIFTFNSFFVTNSCCSIWIRKRLYDLMDMNMQCSRSFGSIGYCKYWKVLQAMVLDWKRILRKISLISVITQREKIAVDYWSNCKFSSQQIPVFPIQTCLSYKILRIYLDCTNIILRQYFSSKREKGLFILGLEGYNYFNSLLIFLSI